MEAYTKQAVAALDPLEKIAVSFVFAMIIAILSPPQEILNILLIFFSGFALLHLCLFLFLLVYFRIKSK